MDQICITVPAAAAPLIVVGASLLANAVPAPDKIINPVGRTLSRLLHFIALDIVTAKKKVGE